MKNVISLHKFYEFRNCVCIRMNIPNWGFINNTIILEDKDLIYIDLKNLCILKNLDLKYYRIEEMYEWILEIVKPLCIEFNIKKLKIGKATFNF